LHQFWLCNSTILQGGGAESVLRNQFEHFVHAHLDRRATPGSVTRECQYSCPRDGTALTLEQVQRVIRLGRPRILCPVGRELATASAVLRGKEEVAEFDVFLCHNWKEKPAVREIARRLRERGLRPWLDERQLRPGIAWQAELEDIIADIPAAAVVVGDQLGPWQEQELAAFMRQSVKRRCVVVSASPGPASVQRAGLGALASAHVGRYRRRLRPGGLGDVHSQPDDAGSVRSPVPSCRRCGPVPLAWRPAAGGCTWWTRWPLAGVRVGWRSHHNLVRASARLSTPTAA
jgi:hypothetical protein